MTDTTTTTDRREQEQRRESRRWEAQGFSIRRQPDTAEIAAAEANAALVMQGYEAFGRGDVQGALAVFDENISWHIPGRGPLSRDYRGHAEVLGFFARFMELSGGTFRIQIDEIFAKGDRVIVLCTESAQRGGRYWSSPQVHLWIVKNGRATVFRQFQGDQQTEDEFWAESG
jgi:ketosteroid isomerase-like protein